MRGPADAGSRRDFRPGRMWRAAAAGLPARGFAFWLPVSDTRSLNVHMRFDIVTIFPAMVQQALAAGIVGRALERGILQAAVHDLREFTSDRHRVVDDVPYGGGPGMVLKPEPIFRALDALAAADGGVPTVVLTSPQGTRLTQQVAQRLARAPRLALVCGRYEGVDERVRTRV